jgi:hypothetical protein
MFIAALFTTASIIHNSSRCIIPFAGKWMEQENASPCSHGCLFISLTVSDSGVDHLWSMACPSLRDIHLCRAASLLLFSVWSRPCVSRESVLYKTQYG